MPQHKATIYNKSSCTHTAHAFSIENILKIMLCLIYMLITDMMLKNSE